MHGQGWYAALRNHVLLIRFPHTQLYPIEYEGIVAEDHSIQT